MTVAIASWNVNSLKARLPHVLRWLSDTQPDMLLLQELKGETASFPYTEITAAGYHSLVVGQKAYNGVAILSRQPLTLVREALPDDADDQQARYLEAMLGNITIACLYAPNGNPIATEKFDYKLRWLARLAAHAQHLFEREAPVILGGDFNIIPTACDAATPTAWQHDALFQPASRAAWQRLCNLGYSDAFRALHPEAKGAYSFWDYQQGAWLRDDGIRIDHFLLSPEATDRLRECHIDRTPRGWDKASDHTPIIIKLAA